jgi:acetyl esterase/lipase
MLEELASHLEPRWPAHFPIRRLYAIISTVPRIMGLTIAAILLVSSIVLACAYRGKISFALELYKAYRTARSFYAQYEHLARDIAFDPDMSPRLDVYSPPSSNRGSHDSGHPTLLFVHGGAWRSYRKELFALVAMKMLPREMVVVIPDYTLYPNAQYEQMAEEVAAAIRWTLDNIQDYGGDPRRVVVAGHSAGAHLLGLAVMDPRFLGSYAAEVCGLVGLSGVYDVQAEYDFWRAKGTNPRVISGVMGGADNFRRASPLTYVRGDLPPTLLIHGDQDESVSVRIAIDFFHALQAAGAPAELKIYPGAAHSDYLIAALKEEGAPVMTDLAGFVHACTP